MVERPTDSDGPDVLRPPAVFFIAGIAGFLALAGSAPVTVMVRDASVIERLVFGGPLPLLGLALWGFAILRFAQYGDALRRAREAQARPQLDREAEDQALIDQAASALFVPLNLDAPAPATVRRLKLRWHDKHRTLVAARSE